MTLSLLKIKSKNGETTSRTAPFPVAVIVGGTSGLGENTAYKFAKYNTKPTIYIIGRKASAGARVVAELCKINPDPDCCFRFYGCDATLISEIDTICDKILAQERRVNLLFLSPGFTTLSGRTESIEGLDTKMAVNYYGRFRFIERLVPLLQSAAEDDKKLVSMAEEARELYYNARNLQVAPRRVNARVVTVLQPGNEGKLLMNDLDLKNHYSLANAHKHHITFTSLQVLRFARLYPDIGFIHVGPGVVNTGIARSLPIWARIPSRTAMVFANTPDNAAERLYYFSSAPQYRTGGHLVNERAQSMLERAQKRGYLTEELQNVVWEHTKKMYEEALLKASSSRRAENLGDDAKGETSEVFDATVPIKEGSSQDQDNTQVGNDGDISLRSSQLSL